jgi:hypothetical protein
VAIDHRGNKATVYITGNGCVKGLGMEDCNALFSIPVAPDLKAVLIKPATAITVTQMIWIVVLKSLLIHLFSNPLFRSLLFRSRKQRG